MIILKLLYILLIPIILFGVFISGLLIGNNIDLNSINLNADSITSWITALATLAIALLTFVLAYETWKLRLIQITQIDELKKESIKPSIELFLLPNPASLRLMDIHIENNGKGSAKNIQFYFQGENEYEKEVISQFLTLNMLKKGMSSLGAGKLRNSYILNFGELFTKINTTAFDLQIKVNIQYQDINGNKYKTNSILDFSEFKGITEIGGGNPLYEIRKDTEKIRKTLEGFAGNSDSKRLKVDLYTSEDRKKIEEKMLESFEEFRQANKT